MKLKSRIAGSATALVLALGMSAAPAFAAAPIAATGEVIYDQGEMSSRGSCSTIGVGSILNPLKTAGLSLVEETLTSSSKGYPRNSGDVSALRVGECAVRTSAGFSGGTVSGLGDYVFKSVAKFGTKLTGISDCNSIEGADTDERPLTGKMSIGYTDLTKTDAYIRIQGFDTTAADKVWLTGIVAKGEGAGTTIGGNVWFNPVLKIKGAGLYGAAIVDDVKTVGFDESTFTSVATGYATSACFTIGEAIACSTGSGTVGGNGLPGLELIGLGGGVGFDSIALGTPADGVQFLL